MKYCAFLRGVNVNGTAMKMADVCHVFETAGMKNVSAVLATGNIIFLSDEADSELKVLLEKAMSKHYHYEAFLFLKTEDEVFKMLKNNPFVSNLDFHIYTFIGNENIENTLDFEFQNSLKSVDEEAIIADGNFYWKISKGNTLNSTFGKILGRKQYKDQFTSRNLNTIAKIIKKLGV